MAKRAGNVFRTYIDHYAMSGYLNGADSDISQALPDVTVFNSAAETLLVGQYKHGHSHTGFFDGAGSASAIDDVLNTIFNGNDHYKCDLPEGETAALVAKEYIVKLDKKPITAKVGESAVLMNYDAPGSGVMSRGVVLRTGTISGNGNGTGQNLGTTTATQTVQAVIRVISGTFTSFTVIIEESQNDGGGDPYATISGMSQAVAAAGVWRLTFTGATEAWKRVRIADWIGTSAVILVTFGVVS